MTGAAGEAPLALVGFGAEAARALRALGLVALAVPAAPLAEVLGALAPLRFAGALIAPDHEEAAARLVTPDADARKLGRVDSVALAGGLRGSHALETALVRLVEDGGYAARGARVLVAGEGPALRAATGLARLGTAGFTVAAPSLPEAEAARDLLPAGVKGYALALRDPALPTLAERADLVVLAGAHLPNGTLQPFHTVLDLTGGVHPVPSLDAADLPARRLALALEHATGHKFRPEALREAALAF